MTPMDATDFEARYRADADPWRYRTSEYERAKYAATLDACGPGPFAAALELGGSIGVFTGLLAPRCAALTMIDLSPTAVAAARERLGGAAHIDIREGSLPRDLPHGCFDLVVASEILYYLRPPDLQQAIAALERSLAPGGRLVAAHWRPPGPDRWHTADDVHAALDAAPWLEHASAASTSDYRLDAWRNHG